MKRSDAFPSKYLSQTDVEPAITAIIDEVTRETLKGRDDEPDETKAVMYFKNDTVKPMVLNNVNWLACEDLYGDDSDNWGGKPIELYRDANIMFGSKRVGGIRIRAPHGLKEDSGDMRAPLEVWTYAQAVKKCQDVGIDEEALKFQLKEHGLTSYAGSRDTPLVKQLIDMVLNAENPL